MIVSTKRATVIQGFDIQLSADEASELRAAISQATQAMEIHSKMCTPGWYATAQRILGTLCEKLDFQSR